MRGLVASILGLGLAANGLTMLAAPVNWYAMVPGVVDTGPFNPHFVRDIGVAYFVTGGSLVGLAKWPAARRFWCSMRRSISGTPRPGASTCANCCSTPQPSFCPRFWRSGSLGRLLRDRVTPTKEKSDDQMVSPAVDRQVRALVEL